MVNTWSQTHGEDKYVAMFGGLHIEMAVWNTYGNYLRHQAGQLHYPGRNCILWHSRVFPQSHPSHQDKTFPVSALALTKLQQIAFLLTEGPQDENGKESWRQAMISKSPTFQYWDTILRMEILGLIFVRAHREQDFPLYVESLKALVPWFLPLTIRTISDGFLFTFVI